jgi:hypothetical protein
MVQGEILKAAQRDNKSVLILFVVLVMLSGGVMGCYSKYVYNFVAGPAPFTKSLAQSPGMREFVRAEGKLFATGSKEATVYRRRPGRGILGAMAKAAGRGTTEREEITANFMAMFIDGGVLVVKVPPDFSGTVVQGTLVPLPEEFRAQQADLTDVGAAGESGATDPSAAAATAVPAAESLIHPRMIDATSSYRSWNLIVLAAAVILPLSLLGLFYAVRTSRDVTKHMAISRVAKHGPYQSLLPRIEREMALAGEQGHIGSLWVGPNWIVVLTPTLLIFPVKDILAVGPESKTKKSGETTTVTYWLNLWMRAEEMESTIDVTEDELQRVLPRLAELHPYMLLEEKDVALTRKRWTSDSAACARDMEAARRAAAPKAAPAAPPASHAATEPAPTRVPA